MYDDIKTLADLEKKVKQMGINPGKYYILPKDIQMSYTYSFIQKIGDIWEVGVCERDSVHGVRTYQNFKDAVNRFMLHMKYA